MPVTPLRPSDPAQVGPHRLLGRLGQGGMGTVYLGVSPDERAVAVKVLRDGALTGTADPDARRRFRHELESLRRVRGPHLVEVLDADVEADTPYLVTRFVPGTRLDDLVARGGPLAGDSLRQVARGLADALAVLHDAGVVHRDLTPGNVLVLDGQPYVIDLGLATAADVTALTGSGLVIGTPGYLSPEQVTGAAITPAVDVHAWGATVALAGTGRPPYGTGRPEAVLYRIVHEAAELDGLPADLAPLVTAAMDRDPRRRPSSRELLDRLGGRTSAEPVTVHLPRDVDATTLLTPVGLGATVPPLRLSATRSLTAPVRELSRTPATWADAPDEDDAGRPGNDEGAYGASAYRDRSYDGTAYGGGYDDNADHRGAPDREWRDEHLLPYDEEPPTPRQHPARALQVAATTAASLSLVAAATLLAPAVGAAAAVVLLVLLRALGSGSTRLRDRRDRRGDRRRDPLVVLVCSPWHAIVGLVDTALSLPLLVLAAALPAGAVWLADPAVPGLERPELTAAVGVVVALVVGLCRRVHRPSRRMLRSALLVLTPGTAGAMTVLLAISLSAGLLLAAAEGSAPTWWPVESLRR